MTEVVKQRLKDMAEWARERKCKQSGLSKSNYVRIGGNGFRAISVSKDYPLIGYKGSTTSNWEVIFHQFDRSDGLPADVMEGPKEERRLQAFMIRHAISNEMSLKGLIGTRIKSEHFDDILFAFDEISLGDKGNQIQFIEEFDNNTEGIIRCDLLCVAVKGDRGYPLLIELKYDRSLGRLLEQLNEFSGQVSTKYRSEFELLLTNATGIDVDCSRVFKVMVWPPSSSGQERKATADKLSESDVAVIEYTAVNNDAGYLTSADFSYAVYE